MADLAQPLKHYCNISRLSSALEEAISLSPAAKAVHNHTASLYYSVQMSDGASAAAWKTLFQSRKSGFQTHSPPKGLSNGR